eukprot:scaffold8602_cov196-Amphora_coffeaeformis.AAC.20
MSLAMANPTTSDMTKAKIKGPDDQKSFQKGARHEYSFHTLHKVDSQGICAPGLVNGRDVTRSVKDDPFR